MQAWRSQMYKLYDLKTVDETQLPPILLNNILKYIINYVIER